MTDIPNDETRAYARMLRHSAKQQAELVRQLPAVMGSDNDIALSQSIAEAQAIVARAESYIWFFRLDTAVNPHTGVLEDPNKEVD